MTLQTVQGDWFRYVVEETAVLDSQTDQLFRYPEEASLLLVTCYPFDALLPGGPLRYVVKARAIAPLVIPQTAASAMTGGRTKGRGMMGNGSQEIR